MKLERLHHRSEPSLHCLKEKVAILTIASVQPAQYVLFVIYSSLNNNKPIRASAITRRAEFLKTFGVAVLVLGYITASIVYWVGENRSAIASRSPQTSNLENSWKDSTLSPEDSKGSSRTIEMNYGKVAVLIVNWLHRWARLKPHELLAGAIATIATLIAVSLFLVGNRGFRVRRISPGK
jgi:hypothetical protein